MDSIIAWAVLCGASFWGLARLAIAIIEENEQRKTDSEWAWREWERSFYETY